jgi:hypothetical protein
VPDGSYLAISHLTPDIQPKAMAELARRLNDASKETFVMRNRAQVSRFLDRLEIIEPGVVQLDEWRPNHTQPVPPSGWVPFRDRRVAKGDTGTEALRALKRRLSDVVFRALSLDATPATAQLPPAA